MTPTPDPQEYPHVGPSGDTERPIAVRLVDTGDAASLSRDDAWRLLHRLQSELVRTLPAPPAYPRPTR